MAPGTSRHRHIVGAAIGQTGSMSALDLLSAIGVIAVLVGLLLLVNRIEPHWAARDGRQFISRAQFIDGRGLPHGRWHDFRFVIGDDGVIEARRRGTIGPRPRTFWRAHARAEALQRRRAVYVFQAEDSTMLAVRVPPDSRAAVVLDQLINRR